MNFDLKRLEREAYIKNDPIAKVYGAILDNVIDELEDLETQKEDLESEIEGLKDNKYWLEIQISKLEEQKEELQK
jgi:peptidoglycan hydrolase CwlO-like protein